MSIQKDDPRALFLKETMESYATLSNATWEALLEGCAVRSLKKGEFLISMGAPSRHFYFVCAGLFQAFTVSEDGKEYTKIFFPENTFPGSIRALLTGEISTFAVQALEDSTVISIDYVLYRKLLEELDDLKWYHIQYLEKNWVLAKEPLEVAFVLDDARTRYEAFVKEYPDLVKRVPLQFIASRLGITPTQLSRVRKSRSV